MSAAPADPETLGIVTDVGAVAGLLAAVFKAADDLNEVLNSPQMLAARQSAGIQAALAKMNADSLAAMKSGSLHQVDVDSSG
jgi:hypothetical protein